MFIKSEYKDILKCISNKQFLDIQKDTSCLNHLFSQYKKMNSLDEYLTVFNES